MLESLFGRRKNEVRMPEVWFPLTLLWFTVRVPLLKRAALLPDPVITAPWTVRVPEL